MSEARRAAGCVILRRTDRAILLLRNRKLGHWGLAKGHRDAGDRTDIACALREVREELGPARIVLVPGFREELRYTIPAGTYKRQEEPIEKVVVMLLAWWPDGAEPALSKEHAEARWVTLEEMARLVEHDSLREVIARAVAFAAGR